MAYYEARNVSNSSFVTECYLEIDNALDNQTDYFYSNEASIIGGVGGLLTSIIGFGLNVVVLIACRKVAALRKDYHTPFMISLALTDCLFSVVALPIEYVNYFMRYVLSLL